MTKVKVIVGFLDARELVERKPGDVFDATDERAAEIAAKLPGYVEVQKPRRTTKKKEQ